MSYSDNPAMNAVKNIPDGIFSAADYEQCAKNMLTPAVFAYIAGGNTDEKTLQANRNCFRQFGILPRVLNDLTKGHTRLSLPGAQLTHPILLAPVAFQQLVDCFGETETARAAAATETCMTVSTLSTTALEAIPALMQGGTSWFQLYFQPRFKDTVDLLQRAEQAGYQAVVVTLDASIQSPSVRALRLGFRMPGTIQPVNLSGYPLPPQISLEQGSSLIFQGMMSEAPTWDSFRQLLAETKLPVYVKGVLDCDDALRLQAMGVAGIIVSNHGGRTLDGVPAPMSVIRNIRRAVGTDLPLILDSGIRSGSDIFKAIANGANAVMIGRLQMYALAVAGAQGVAHMIQLLRQELELCMALAGCPCIGDINETMIYSEKHHADTY